MNEETLRSLMENCTLCPRKCGANRAEGRPGFCGESAEIRCARAGLHLWEEPVLSGTRGSGTVFFSGCNLRCVFCQNRDIALGKTGFSISPRRLSEIFLELQEKGAHNINLVTGTHFLPQIALALEIAKPGLHIPVVYNTSSYELSESLRLLEGLVDIYLPDLKYFSTELSKKYSAAPDYFETAMDAIREMLRQTGDPEFDENGLLRKGIIVRHLILPGQTKDSKKILRRLHEEFSSRIYISIMNQYTPMGSFPGMEELERSVSEEEYRRVLHFAEALGIECGFFQEGGTVSDSFIPAFDGTGILKP